MQRRDIYFSNQFSRFTSYVISLVQYIKGVDKNIFQNKVYQQLPKKLSRSKEALGLRLSSNSPRLLNIQYI